MISYSQNFEDVILNRIFKNAEKGFYIDIGAMHPVEHSVTKWFYDLGWRGINVEPNPKAIKLFFDQRSDEVNLAVAITDIDGEIYFNSFDEIDLDNGLGLSSIFEYDYSNFASIDQGKFKKIQVKSKTINSLHKENYVPPTYEFLKIDVEGAERNILIKADFSFYRPKVIIVEATKPLSDETNHLDWEPFIIKQKYHFAYFDGLNRFYLSNEFLYQINEEMIFSKPPNVFDGFIKYSELRARTEAEAARTEAEAARTEAEAARTRQQELEFLIGEILQKNRELEQLRIEAASWLQQVRALRTSRSFRFGYYALHPWKIFTRFGEKLRGH